MRRVNDVCCRLDRLKNLPIHILEKCLSLRLLAYVNPAAPPSDRTLRKGVKSQSPKAGHPKAGRSDFRNQRFKPDTGKMRRMRTSLPPQENKGLRKLRRTKARKTRKMRKNVGTSNFQSEVGEVFGEIGGELPAKFGRRFSSFFCWENRQKHFPPKLHRKFHHQTSLRGSGLWRALKMRTQKRGKCG